MQMVGDNEEKLKIPVEKNWTNETKKKMDE